MRAVSALYSLVLEAIPSKASLTIGCAVGAPSGRSRGRHCSVRCKKLACVQETAGWRFCMRDGLDGLGWWAGVSVIALGSYHSCAVLVGGDLKCWGYNRQGQLGTGDTNPRLSPALVNLGSGNKGLGCRR